MKSRTRYAGLFLLVLILGGSCERKTPETTPPADVQAYIQQIETQRREKDEFFKNSDASPLLPEDRKTFTGLHYYPVDPELRFEGPIIRYDPPVPDTIMGTRGGDIRPAHKYGYFEFTYRGKTYRLQIYKILNSKPGYEDYLFLGFTDETSGKETYGGGRYIDLVENPQNHYVVDFNLAYNPYCAYNPNYSCAIPPEENHLPFPVRAGEKIFKNH
ncbi:MAG: DUF1684 domain-containing protein [Calditrichaeota bacterium]|nr:MAG: DUF1684 domain-containing protein [Calditrichota bacterium]